MIEAYNRFKYVCYTPKANNLSKGIPTGRHENIRIATNEARRHVLQSKDMLTTKIYMKRWLALRYALSRTTISDYVGVIEFRLQQDPEVKAALKAGPTLLPPAKAVFKSASAGTLD